MSDHERFEWDPAKARRNIQKHAVSFESATIALVNDQWPASQVVLYDEANSTDEERWITIASVPSHRPVILTVSWTQRVGGGGRAVTRIISARKATRQERNRYEQERRNKDG